MKGIVFDLLEEIVVREHGDQMWDLLLEEAGVLGAYTTLGNYPDEELTALIAAASKTLDIGQPVRASARRPRAHCARGADLGPV